LPFSFDAATVTRGLNFTLDTTLGPLDLLGEVAGGGAYDALLPHTEPVELFGYPCRTVSLDALIRLKRAAGRPKDHEMLAELEALRDRRRQG
jgi:hypothetical protein